MADLTDEVSLQCLPDCLEVGKPAKLRGNKSQYPNLQGSDRFWLLIEACSHTNAHIGARWKGPKAGGKSGGSCSDLLAALT